MKYNVLIIGAGNKGALSDAPGRGNEHKYLSYAHVVNDHPGFELQSFWDTDKKRQFYAIKLWDAHVLGYCCLKHAFEFDDLDVVIVSTPDETHYDILKQLAEYPLKLVICEKPLCTDLHQAREIVELYQQKNIPILVDYTRRFIPEYQQMKAEIDAGKWGAFLEGYGYFNRGWLHTGSHMVDFVLWMRGTMDGFRITEIGTDYRWIYQIGMFYFKDFFSDHAVNFVKNPHVDIIYDKHLWYVMDNAFEFLEGRQKLLCTGEDALRTLEECFRQIKQAERMMFK
jgi:predicted dehydrogenase